MLIFRVRQGERSPIEIPVDEFDLTGAISATIGVVGHGQNSNFETTLTVNKNNIEPHKVVYELQEGDIDAPGKYTLVVHVQMPDDSEIVRGGPGEIVLVVRPRVATTA